MPEMIESKIVAKMTFNILHHKSLRVTKVELSQEIPDDSELIVENVKNQMQQIYHACYIGNTGTHDGKRFFKVEKSESQYY